ncbi:hypothetical protein ACWCQS_39505 [Streptomyces sp. NPDC002076]
MSRSPPDSARRLRPAFPAITQIGTESRPGSCPTAAVSDISRALDGTDLDGVLARLPTAPPAAAAACGFPGFSGDVRAYLAGHFTATRAFFREAARRGMCVVVRID